MERALMQTVKQVNSLSVEIIKLKDEGKLKDKSQRETTQVPLHQVHWKI